MKVKFSKQNDCFAPQQAAMHSSFPSLYTSHLVNAMLALQHLDFV